MVTYFKVLSNFARLILRSYTTYSSCIDPSGREYTLRSEWNFEFVESFLIFIFSTFSVGKLHDSNMCLRKCFTFGSFSSGIRISLNESGNQKIG